MNGLRCVGGSMSGRRRVNGSMVGSNRVGVKLGQWVVGVWMGQWVGEGVSAGRSGS